MQAGRLLRVLSALFLSGMALWFLLLWEQQQNFPAGSPFLNPVMNFMLPLGFAVIAYLVVDAVARVTQHWREQLKLGLLEQVVMVCGVIIPSFAVLGFIVMSVPQLEHSIRVICRAPFSYAWQALFVIAVPVCTYFALKEFRPADHKRPLRLGLLCGVPLGVAFLWTVIFAPVYPQIIREGMYQGYQILLNLPYALQRNPAQNLLVLVTMLCLVIFAFCMVASPVLCLVCCILLIAKFWSFTDKNFAMKTSACSGVAAIACLIMLFLPDLPWIVTSIGMEKALSPAPEVSRAGIRILRAIGNKEEMLKACYGAGDARVHLTELARQTWIPSVTYLRPWSEQARSIFYRVTGKPFNMFPPPSQWGNDFSRWERGGSQVGGRVNVSLEASSIQGHVDPNAALGYVEWTMIFRNLSDQAEEARTHIALPPGGVVSRLTLWVDSAPHEAVFNSRSLVRSAYQAVVQARRDPVLVETAGPDRVMMQCFPVPPKSQGKAMKVRMGISFPLTLKDRDSADFTFPRLVENNFNDGTFHQVQITTTHASTKLPAGLNIHRKSDNDHFISGSISSQAFCQLGTIIRFSRDPQTTIAWCKDTRGYSDGIVMQRLEETQVIPPKRLFVVIDGSHALADQAKELIEALAKIPNNISTKVFFASDEISALCADGAQDGTALNSALQELRHAPFIGGPDNLPYLQQALQSAGNSTDSAVIWIHGPAPLEIPDPVAAVSSIQTLASKTQFYEIEAKEGPNKLLAVLYDPMYARKPLTQNLRRTGTLSQDLENVFKTWNGNSMKIQPVWSQASKEPSSKGSVLTPVGDLVPLWAKERTEELLASPETENEATQFATKYRIVTRVTGAVVLESREQYLAFGLDPETAEPNFNKKKHDEEMARVRAEWFRAQARKREAQDKIKAARRVVKPKPATPAPTDPVVIDELESSSIRTRDENVPKGIEVQSELKEFGADQQRWNSVETAQKKAKEKVQESSPWPKNETAETNSDYKSDDAPTGWLLDLQSTEEKSLARPDALAGDSRALPSTSLDAFGDKRQVTDIEFLPAQKDSGGTYTGAPASRRHSEAGWKPALQYGGEGTSSATKAPAAEPVPASTPVPPPVEPAPITALVPPPVSTSQNAAGEIMSSSQQKMHGSRASSPHSGGTNTVSAQPGKNASPSRDDARVPLQLLALVLTVLGIGCVLLGWTRKRSPAVIITGTLILISGCTVMLGAPVLADLFLTR